MSDSDLQVSSPGDKITFVTYRPDMPMYQYVGEVLAKELRLPKTHNGLTVQARISYRKPDGGMVAFDRENREKLLKDAIPAGANLEHTLAPNDASLFGNAAKFDIMDECDICHDTALGPKWVQIKKCKQLFHFECFTKWSTRFPRDRTTMITCPGCNAPVPIEEEMEIWVQEALIRSMGDQ